ncbi:hypothetical protein O2W15_21635 [Modestobacter sp. VKM Ac-2979]|uniref:hypothetical protein n=1 Tax=unclassified Modestobacter TaxID=2643866 RepID=UPI0022AB8BE4|nr:MULTISPECIES: hypothetical protein [unclassified Modestobacter]MCZ2814039.1 hypothetical protein [Modestobacter sp. VKM Ac-2979]MCZ2844545.1 hypothetical protein [Modestobacter sp. VKM Ac-2980]
MTDPDRAARDSALNDAEFPDDERGLTGTADGPRGDVGPEGQTARDVFPEDNGIPEVSQDDSPTMARAEDPEFAPEPGDRQHQAVDFGTTAREQAEGESLSGRLEREVAEDASDVRPAEDPDRAFAQLDQDEDTDRLSDSGTNRTGDDVEAFADAPVGGEGPEESAVHVIEGT